MVTIKKFVYVFLFGLLQACTNIAKAETQVDVDLRIPRLTNIFSQQQENVGWMKNYIINVAASGNIDKAQWVLKSDAGYRYGARPEVHLADAYIRMPFGVNSVYGGIRELAWGCYYRLPGYGLFGAVTRDIHDGSFNEKVKPGASLTFGGHVPCKLKQGVVDYRFSWIGYEDLEHDHRRQKLLLELSRGFSKGYALKLALSDNKRWFKGRKTTGYQVLMLGYEHKVRPWFTVKANCGFSYAGSYGGRKTSWSPAWGLQLKGEM